MAVRRIFSFSVIMCTPGFLLRVFLDHDLRSFGNRFPAFFCAVPLNWPGRVEKPEGAMLLFRPVLQKPLEQAEVRHFRGLVITQKEAELVKLAEGT